MRFPPLARRTCPTGTANVARERTTVPGPAPPPPIESCAGSIPAASTRDRSPLRLAPQHDDFDRIAVPQAPRADDGEAVIGGVYECKT